jgi:NADH:ubiquinone oxidoreductase subunit C
MTNEELKQVISAHTPEAVFEETQFLNVLIPSEKIYPLAKHLKENPNTDFDYLFCLSGVDWKTHFIIVYHLQSRKHKHILVLKAKIADRNNPKIDSVSSLWKTAEFHEREVYDLFGIKFNNHPDLRRLFLDDTWGFPLRKDYEDDVTIVSL